MISRVRPNIATHKQRGVVLVAGLVILVVLTLIGVATLESTAMEERMASNMRDMNLAFHSAETAMREAEADIDALANTDGFGTSGGYYTLGDAPDPFSEGAWTGGSSIVATTNMGRIVQPRYYIELMGDFNNDPDLINILNYGEQSSEASTVFRIITRGTGASGNAQVILEGFYGRVF
ncbi:MAG: hypothetical protein CMF50_06130 [Legionellales bacterium]|nr:hypothetical protein [Legionellales bacterium]|tara:strand:- start:14566 stop:15099 length:534 start_codon:yes stop_codon:yes gene_type:complete